MFAISKIINGSLCGVQDGIGLGIPGSPFNKKPVWPVKKLPNVHKSCRKMISLDKLKMTPLQKLPKIWAK